MAIVGDYHIHTPLCLHASGPMEACVERAIQLGLREVGFACHNPLPAGVGADVRMREDQLGDYVRQVLELRDRYRGRVEVLLGIEMDYVEDLEEYLAEQVDRYSWDYVIGSVHYLDCECQLGAWKGELPFDADEQYTRYFGLVQHMVRSGLCEIVSHLDVPKRSGRMPGQRGLEELELTLQEIARADLCIEINTSGYRHADLELKETYPALAIVEQAMALDIPFIVNSDAHAPDQVGLKFVEIESFLREKGCRQLARFKQRRREMYAL